MDRIATATLSIGDAPIPQLGFGTYGMSGPKLRKVLVAALQHGFRHIDTAQMYQNEADVGAANSTKAVAINVLRCALGTKHYFLRSASFLTI